MIPPHNNLSYRRLAAFQVCTLLVDATKRFCEDFMYQEPECAHRLLQTACSARQRAALGCRGGHSSDSRMAPLLAQRYRSWEFDQLIDGRADLEKLLLSFEDFLRWRQLPQWNYSSEESCAVRAVANQFQQSQDHRSSARFLTELSDAQRWDLYIPWLTHADPTVRVNAIINLIHQANHWMERSLENFEWPAPHTMLAANQGMSRETISLSRAAPPPIPLATSNAGDSPACPSCGGPMRLRVARQGQQSGKQFWGCNGYPHCRGVADVGPS